MHHSAANFIIRARQHLARTLDPLDLASFEVVEVGSRDINGRASTYWGPHGRWVGIDVEPGLHADDVQVVGDAAAILSEWNDEGNETFDLAVSCEVFEHAVDWRKILVEMHIIADFVLITCASDGRPPHSAVDGGAVRPGEYYANVSQVEMEEALAQCGAVPIIIEHNRRDGDLYLLAH